MDQCTSDNFNNYMKSRKEKKTGSGFKTCNKLNALYRLYRAAHICNYIKKHKYSGNVRTKFKIKMC